MPVQDTIGDHSSHLSIDDTRRPSLVMTCKTWTCELSGAQNDEREEHDYESTQNHTPEPTYL